MRLIKKISTVDGRRVREYGRRSFIALNVDDCYSKKQQTAKKKFVEES